MKLPAPTEDTAEDLDPDVAALALIDEVWRVVDAWPEKTSRRFLYTQLRKCADKIEAIDKGGRAT